MSAAASVSPTVTSAIPATVTSSPGPADSVRDPVEAGRDEELGHADLLDYPVPPAPRDGLAVVDRALDDAADRQTAEVRGGVEVGDERLEGRRPP